MHSRAGLSLLRSAGREGASYGKGVPPASSATGSASPRWVAWRQICFAFAALMAAQLGPTRTAPLRPPRSTPSSPRVAHCCASCVDIVMAQVHTEDGTTIAPLLRVATAVAKEAIHADAASPS